MLRTATACLAGRSARQGQQAFFAKHELPAEVSTGGRPLVRATASYNPKMALSQGAAPSTAVVSAKEEVGYQSPAIRTVERSALSQ